MSLTLQNPPVPNPESAMLPGMAAPAPRATPPGPVSQTVQVSASISIPDTSIGPVALQEPPAWTYDFDPATGIGRASFPGEVVIAGTPAGGPTTGTGAFVLQTSPTIAGPTITGPTITGTIAGGPTIAGPTITGPTITGAIAGAPSLSGTATNNNAPAGSVGEYLSAQQTVAQVLTTSVPFDIITLSLTAGDWDVRGIVTFGSAATAFNVAQAWINTVSATQPVLPNLGYHALVFGAGTNIANGTSLPTGPVRISIATTTTVYLTGDAVFTGGATSCYGMIAARRAR